MKAPFFRNENGNLRIVPEIVEVLRGKRGKFGEDEVAAIAPRIMGADVSDQCIRLMQAQGRGDFHDPLGLISAHPELLLSQLLNTV